LLSLEAKKSVDDSVLVDRLDESLKIAWKQVMLKSVDQIRNRIRDMLGQSLAGTVIDSGTAQRYPFLADLTLFVSRYISCVEVHIGDDSVNVVINPITAESFGFPKNIADLLEYGSSDFPQIAHLREAMETWNNKDRPALMDEVVRTVSGAMNTEKA